MGVGNNSALIAAVETRASTLEGNASAQQQELRTLHASAADQGVAINANAGALSALASGPVAANTATIAKHTLNITMLRGLIVELDTSLSDLQALDIAILHGNASDLQAATLELAADLAAHAIVDASHDGQLSVLEDVVENHGASIGLLNATAAWLEGNASAQQQELRTLHASAADQGVAINANAGALSALASGPVAANTATIAKHTLNITMLRGLIVELDTSLSDLQALDIAILHGNASDLQAATLELAADLAAHAIVDASHDGQLSVLEDVVENHGASIGLLNATAAWLEGNASAQQQELRTLHASAADQGVAINANAGALSALASGPVAANTATIAKHTLNITMLRGLIVELDTSLSDLQALDIAILHGNASDLQAATLELAADLAAHAIVDASHDGQLSVLEDVVENHGASIGLLNATAAWLEGNASAQQQELRTLHASAADQGVAINANAGALSALASGPVAANTANISALSASSGSHALQLVDLQSVASTLDFAISGLLVNDSGLSRDLNETTARVAALEALGIEHNTDAIEALHADVVELEESVTTLDVNVTTLYDSISELDASLSSLEQLDIAVLQNNASDLQAATLQLAMELAAHAVVDGSHDNQLSVLQWGLATTLP